MERTYNKLIRDNIPDIIISKLENQTLEDIIRLAEEKRAERGGFDNKIYLEKVIER